MMKLIIRPGKDAFHFDLDLEHNGVQMPLGELKGNTFTEGLLHCVSNDAIEVLFRRKRRGRGDAGFLGTKEGGAS